MDVIRALLLSLTLLSVNSFAENFNALVIGVIDGDTIKVLKEDKISLKIRLENIDAPEMGQAFGSKSKQYVSKLIYRHNVYIVSSSIDRYGRSIGTIYLNGVNINKEIVVNGYAWAYRHFLNDNEYLLLEDNARKSRRGLWADNYPIEPYIFRKDQKAKKL